MGVYIESHKRRGTRESVCIFRAVLSTQPGTMIESLSDAALVLVPGNLSHLRISPDARLLTDAVGNRRTREERPVVGIVSTGRTGACSSMFSYYEPTHSRRSRCVRGYNKRSVIEVRGERPTAIHDRTNELGVRSKRCYAGLVLVLSPPPDNGSPDDSDENSGHAVDAEVTGCDAFGPSSREDEQDDPQKN